MSHTLPSIRQQSYAAKAIQLPPTVWQPRPRSQITPPVEVLYHYIRLFASQNKLTQAWHILRWLHSAYSVALSKDASKKSFSALSTLKECIEKGWLFVCNGPAPESKNPRNIIVPAQSVTPDSFVPPMDLLYNYVDELNKLSLTKTCWHLFEWLSTAFNQACKRDMNPYSTGAMATALKNALATCSIVASPRDVPYMQDTVRQRSALGFEEQYVTWYISDAMWDRIPPRFQLDILEVGRFPQTPRNRYGHRLTAPCLHKVNKKTMLAEGGCDCADREDVRWSEIPSFEKALLDEHKEDATNSDDEASLTDASTVSSEEVDPRDEDADSAYESDNEKTENTQTSSSKSSQHTKALSVSTKPPSINVSGGTSIACHVRPQKLSPVERQRIHQDVLEHWIMRTNFEVGQKRMRYCPMPLVAVPPSTIIRRNSTCSEDDEARTPKRLRKN